MSAHVLLNILNKLEGGGIKQEARIYQTSSGQFKR